MFTLYVHKNKSNDKVYVGYTGRTVTQRWGKDGTKYLQTNKKGQLYHPRFANAILKYGWDNFEHIIIRDDIESEKEAHQLEQELIREYNATDEKFGYNMTEGGEGMKGRYPTKETRKRMSEAKIGSIPWNKDKKGVMIPWNKGKPHSEEEKKKISEGRKGKEPWNKGKKGVTVAWNKGLKGQYSKETIEKMTLANRSPEKIQRTKEANSVPVRLVELDKYFASIEMASKETGVNKSNIVAVCKGKRKKAGGYHWQYVAQ